MHPWVRCLRTLDLMGTLDRCAALIILGADLSSSMRQKRPLIIDLDGTLYNADLTYEKALAVQGLSTIEPAYVQARRSVKEQMPSGHVGARDRLSYFKKILEAQNQFTPAALLQMMTQYEASLTQEVLSQWATLGRAAWCAQMAENFEMLILTNENLRTQMVKVQGFGHSIKYFKGILTSGELGFEKPEPSIFHEAATRLNAAIEDCIVIGDSVQADVLPAVNLGAQAVWTTEFLAEGDIQKGETLLGNKSVKRVGKLDEIFEILEQ